MNKSLGKLVAGEEEPGEVPQALHQQSTSPGSSAGAAGEPAVMIAALTKG